MHNSSVILELHHSSKTDVACRVRAAVIDVEVTEVNFVNVTSKGIRS